MWPENQLFLTTAELKGLLTTCRARFEQTRRQLEIEQDLSPLLPSLYLPCAAWLNQARKNLNRPLVIGLCGAQGAGKSTFSMLLQAALAAGWSRRVVSFSIDDIYKTRAERQQLARDLHPLFATRGVPGTHDVALGVTTLQELRNLGAGLTLALPAFDKAADERRPRETWPTVTGPVDMVIFDGWCVGAAPEPEEALTTPINELEQKEDPEGAWRRASQRALAQDYQRMFSWIDVLLMLKVQGMENVFTWRRLQEQKLRAEAGAKGLATGASRVMSDADLNRFIMHYERLTRHMLAEMPARADIVFAVDHTHNPARVQINKPIILA